MQLKVTSVAYSFLNDHFRIPLFIEKSNLFSRKADRVETIEKNRKMVYDSTYLKWFGILWKRYPYEALHDWVLQ